MPAVQVHRARGLVAWSVRVGRRFGIRAGVSVVLVLVVTEVSDALGLVLAVRGHRSPAELERQHDEQDDGKEAAHGQESSGYRVGLGSAEATGLWGLTTSMRGPSPRCGSSVPDDALSRIHGHLSRVPCCATSADR